MIRRLFTLVWAVAGRSKAIQELVAIVWPRASAARAADASPAASVTPSFVAAPVVTEVLPSPVDLRRAPEPRVADAPPAVVEASPAEVEASPVAAAPDAPAAEVEASPAAAAPDAPPAALVVDASVVEAPPLPLRPLRHKEAMDGSVWVPRILWALEFAKLRDLGPQSASDISRVLGEHSGLNVPSPNVARAFRDRKEQGASYWKELDGQRYEISRAGSAALRKQLRSDDN